MNLSRNEILNHIKKWLIAWDRYDLDAVMDFMHEDILFENWDGTVISGKAALKRLWAPWFIYHGNFKFIEEDIFFDELEQKVVFQWLLEWPSIEKRFKGKHEIRRGIDVLHFVNGKIYKKISYSKTKIQINSALIKLQAE